MSMKRKMRFMAIILTFIITVTILSSSSVFGESSNTLDTSGTAPADLQLYTAQIYAKHFGVSVNDALFRIKVPSLLPDLQPALSKDEADTYGGAWIQNEPEFKVVVAFTLDGAATIDKYRQYIPAEVAPHVEIRIVQKTLSQLLNDQQQILSFLRNTGLKAETGVDVINNRARLDIFEVDKAIFEKLAQDEAETLPEDIGVNYVKGMAEPDSVYGGLAQNDGTTGLSVINGSGVRGIATAAHLSDYISITDQNGNLVTTTYQGGIYSGCYDCQWSVPAAWAPVTNTIKYWYDGSTLSITSTTTRASMWINQIVSKYGNTTGYTCGMIKELYDTPPGIPNVLPTWVRVDNDFGYANFAYFGDSGCPWFSGNTAFGIHWGHLGNPPSQPVVAAYFMSVEFIPGGLGVYVLTW
jgi:hypothetical protein